MRNFIFFILLICILTAIGTVFYLWQKEENFSYLGGFKNEEPVFSFSPEASQYLETPLEVEKDVPTATFIFQKPEENQVVKFPIFNYHHIRPMPASSTPINERSFTVTPEGFEEHLKYFKDNGYQIVLARELIDYFDTGRPLSAKAVAITFDDGRYGQYKWAFPLLKKYNAKATFFITTSWVGKKDFLTWDQIKEMSESGMEIGSHSISHPHLSALGDKDLKHELEDSKKIIEEKIGKKIDLLAYPGGDFSQRVIEYAQAAGYKAAFGVYKIIDQSPKYRFSIRRFHADDALESITSKLLDY